MVGDYVREHPVACPESCLTDCLVATQCSASCDDTERVVHFREAWRQILARSREQIEDLMQADLDLAKQDGTYRTRRSLVRRRLLTAGSTPGKSSEQLAGQIRQSRAFPFSSVICA